LIKSLKKQRFPFKNGVNAFINNKKLIFGYFYSLVVCDIFQRKLFNFNVIFCLRFLVGFFDMRIEPKPVKRAGRIK